MISKKNILVTGGAGFVGSHVVRSLVNEGHAVSLFVKKTTNTERISDVLSKVRLYKEDLSNPVKLKKNIQIIKPDGIFHFATSNMQGGITASDDDIIKNNINGTINLLSALSPIPYDFFIQTGSFLEYGMKKKPLRETDFPEPINLYSISKLAATLYGQAIAKTQNKPIVTLRLFTPYGPDIQKGRLVHTVIQNALLNTPINLTHPSIARDFIFVEDVADLCLEAMHHATEFSGQIFNAGSGISTTLDKLVKEVLLITGSASKVEWGTFRSVSYDSDNWQANMTKTLSSFSWKPKTSLHQGLLKTVDWFTDPMNS